MALGDLLSGFAEAGHEHNTMLFSMAEQQKKDLGEKYFQISNDPNSPPEVQQEATNRVIGLHTLEPGKKIPKEWTNFTFTVQPKAYPPTPMPEVPSMSAPAPFGTTMEGVGTGMKPGAGAPIPGMAPLAPSPQEIAPPPTAPYQMSMGTKYTPEQLSQQAGARAAAISTAQEPALQAKLDAAAQKAKEAANQKIITEAMKTQQMPIFDANGDLAQLRPMSQDELSAFQKSVTGKNAAQTSQAQSVANVNTAKVAGTLPPSTPSPEMQAFNAYTAEQKRKGLPVPDIKAFLKDYWNARPNNSVSSFILNNPGAGVSRVGYIVDQLSEDASPAAISLLIGTDKVLKKQVGEELARRGTTIDQLTAQTRQLSQTARDLLPTFDSILKTINTPEMQAKLGPAMGRWNEFESGKYGAGDPDFTKLRTAVELLKTGVIKAHFGGRGGGQALLDRFDSLAAEGRMDAPTLTAALSGMRDFLAETYVTPRYGKAENPAPNPPPNAKQAGPIDLSRFERGATTAAPASAPASPPARK